MLSFWSHPRSIGPSSCHSSNMYAFSCDSWGHHLSYLWLIEQAWLATAKNSSLAPLLRGNPDSEPPWCAPSLPLSLLIWVSVFRHGEDGDFLKHGYYFVSIFGPPGCHVFNFKASLEPFFTSASWKQKSCLLGPPLPHTNGSTHTSSPKGPRMMPPGGHCLAATPESHGS